MADRDDATLTVDMEQLALPLAQLPLCVWDEVLWPCLGAGARTALRNTCRALRGITDQLPSATPQFLLLLHDRVAGCRVVARVMAHPGGEAEELVLQVDDEPSSMQSHARDVSDAALTGMHTASGQDTQRHAGQQVQQQQPAPDHTPLAAAVIRLAVATQHRLVCLSLHVGWSMALTSDVLAHICTSWPELQALHIHAQFVIGDAGWEAAMRALPSSLHTLELCLQEFRDGSCPAAALPADHLAAAAQQLGGRLRRLALKSGSFEAAGVRALLAPPQLEQVHSCSSAVTTSGATGPASLCACSASMQPLRAYASAQPDCASDMMQGDAQQVSTGPDPAWWLREWPDSFSSLSSPPSTRSVSPEPCHEPTYIPSLLSGCASGRSSPCSGTLPRNTAAQHLAPWLKAPCQPATLAPSLRRPHAHSSQHCTPSALCTPSSPWSFPKSTTTSSSRSSLSTMSCSSPSSSRSSCASVPTTIQHSQPLPCASSWRTSSQGSSHRSGLRARACHSQPLTTNVPACYYTVDSCYELLDMGGCDTSPPPPLSWLHEAGNTAQHPPPPPAPAVNHHLQHLDLTALSPLSLQALVHQLVPVTGHSHLQPLAFPALQSLALQSLPRIPAILEQLLEACPAVSYLSIHSGDLPPGYTAHLAQLLAGLSCLELPMSLLSQLGRAQTFPSGTLPGLRQLVVRASDTAPGILRGTSVRQMAAGRTCSGVVVAEDLAATLPMVAPHCRLVIRGCALDVRASTSPDAAAAALWALAKHPGGLHTQLAGGGCCPSHEEFQLTAGVGCCNLGAHILQLLVSHGPLVQPACAQLSSQHTPASSTTAQQLNS